MSLEYEPESFDSMKNRYHLAVEDLIDTAKVNAGEIPAPSTERKHVFDYPDGMRLVISVDVANDKEFLHVSASGSTEYVDTIRDEGMDGVVEDLMLRLCALRGSSPPNQVKSFMSEKGVLHMLFYDGE